MRTSKTILLVLALILAIGAGAALVSAQETETGTVCRPIRDMLGRRAGLTEEARAEREAWKATRIETREKWEALTEEQKAEIYGLEEQIGALRGIMVERYQEWGIVDEETAGQFKERISERITRMQEEGRMPLGGGRHGRHGSRFCFQREPSE